ncbi:MAG: DNA gyrase subunit B, partial [Bacteriovoracaceae bacterium]|nr:DNA gyrase subunit B [Bacteriovoracaceae bacterium]
PPLFKYKKGKSERYLKDEKALEKYLISVALNDTAVKIDGKDEPIEDVIKLLNKYKAYYSHLNSYDRHFDRDFLRKLVEQKTLDIQSMKSREMLEKIIAELSEHFKALETTSLKQYSFDIEEDPKHDSHILRVTVTNSLRTKKFKITSNFVDSADFQDLINHFEGIKSYLGSKFEITSEKKDDSFENLHQFSEFVVALAKQGAYIQRYKGLGEMNPDQLWETTMNPENRTLMQVKIEDTIDADQVFSVLMGDNVEPRREFVENNALNVRNLDI